MREYKKYDEATKNRVARRFLQGEDCQITARENGIPLTTVRSWVKKKTIEEAQEEAGEVLLTRTRGGACHVKISDEYNAFLEQRINEKPSVTLKELQAKLQLEIGLTACLTTVGNVVKGMMYSYKKMYHKPSTMNSLQNREKRRYFFYTLTAAISNGKRIVWQDETNFNFWSTRSTGLSQVGRKTVAARCTCKNQNLHTIGAILQTIGVVYYTIQQGNLKKEDFLQWLQALVNECQIKGIASNELAIVIGNAPVHCRAEDIVETNPGVQIILVRCEKCDQETAICTSGRAV